MQYLMTSHIDDIIHSKAAGSWYLHIEPKDPGSEFFILDLAEKLILRDCRGQQEAATETNLPVHDPSCYLCPGNRRAQGEVNPDYEDTYVFVNDYSAVQELQAEYQPAETDGSMVLSLLDTCVKS